MNFGYKVRYKNKWWYVKTLDWFVSSGCTDKRPSWLTITRGVKDEDGKYVRTDEMEILADKVQEWRKTKGTHNY
jgi:hypothetical protein